MTDTPMFTDKTGEITPALGTFEVTDPTGYKTVVVEGLIADDHLYLVRKNYAGDGWEQFTDGRPVLINVHNRSRTPLEVGEYGLQGEVSGTLTAYTKEP